MIKPKTAKLQETAMKPIIEGDFMKQSYKMSYGSKFNCFIHNLILILKNLLMLFLLLSVEFYLFSITGRYIENNLKLVKFVTAVFYIAVICDFILFFLTIFLPKRVIVKKDIIKIKRYSLNLFFIARGFNDKIVIKDICKCEIYHGKRSFLNPLAPYSVYPLNWNDLLEISTSTKQYLVPVKNAEIFIEEINKRLK